MLATKFARPMDSEGRLQGASRRYIMQRRRGQPAAARHRLYRPLPPAHRRSADADRGDAARARRSRAAGQGALHRLLVRCRPGRSSRRNGPRRISISTPFVACQERYNLLERELDDALMPVLQSYGLGLIPFAPLANGLLTGKYRRDAPPPAGTRLAAMPHIAERYLTEANWDKVERLDAFCAARGHSCSNSRSAGCCTARWWRASSPARPRRSRSRPMSRRPAGACRARTWTRSTASRQTDAT